MGAKYQLGFGPLEVQSVVPRRESDSPAVGQGLDQPRTDGLTLLIQAVSETCSEKEASIALGLPDAAYWSKVKSGDKPAPRIQKLTDLPHATQREYVKRWGRQLGMHVTDEDTRRRAITDAVSAMANALREIG